MEERLQSLRKMRNSIGHEEDRRHMELKKLSYRMTVCKISSMKSIDLDMDFYFLGKTDEEISLVCRTEKAPLDTIGREDGWRGFRIQGELDFSLVGILANETY